MGYRDGPDTVHVMVKVPDKPTIEGLEAKWNEAWEHEGLYQFDRTKERGEVFSIDTPPPTVSGSLHVGHVFSYTHTDAIARYQRMKGSKSFIPWAGTTTVYRPNEESKLFRCSM